MKDDHEDERMTNPPQRRTHREEAKENKGRKAITTRRGEKARSKGMERNSSKRHNKRNRERLSGGKVLRRFAFDEQQDTTTNAGEGGGRNKEEKETNTPPEREGKSKKRATSEGRQQKRRRLGGGRTAPSKPEKRHQRPNTDKPTWGRRGPTQTLTLNNRHYREGPTGINKSQPWCKVFSVTHVRLSC